MVVVLLSIRSQKTKNDPDGIEKLIPHCPHLTKRAGESCVSIERFHDHLKMYMVFACFILLIYFDCNRNISQPHHLS